MRLGNTVGTRINQFDALDQEEQTVKTFNALFPECPLKRFSDDDWVTIGKMLDSNRRELFIGYHDYLEEHKMYSDILYSVNREDCSLNEMEKELTEINGVLL